MKKSFSSFSNLMFSSSEREMNFERAFTGSKLISDPFEILYFPSAVIDLTSGLRSESAGSSRVIVPDRDPARFYALRKFCPKLLKLVNASLTSTPVIEKLPLPIKDLLRF